MGALHAGHMSLVERACRDNTKVVVSIFVNPLQFGPTEDLERYPASPDRDMELLERAGLAAFYKPAATVMYPRGAATRVRVSGVSEPLEGAARPGHFEGVATVVAKLFDATEPDRAYFGQKDAQQAAVVKRLALDLDTGIEICVCPTSPRGRRPRPELEERLPGTRGAQGGSQPQQGIAAGFACVPGRGARSRPPET